MKNFSGPCSRCFKTYSDRSAWRSTSSPAMARADGGAAGNARQPFRAGGRSCRQCQAAVSLGGAALRTTPGSHSAGAGGTGCVARAHCDWSTGGACGHSFRQAPVPVPHATLPTACPSPPPRCTVLMRGRRPQPTPIFNYSTSIQLDMSKWKATSNTWCTRCILIVYRSAVCKNTVKVSAVLIRL